MSYNLKERTPEQMRDCFAGLGCPGVYEVESKSVNFCVLGVGCPGVFDLKRLTPQEQRCIVGACPEVYEVNKENYLIIGKVVDAKDFGLEKNVGDGEIDRKSVV